MPVHLKASLIVAFLILWVCLAALHEGPRVAIRTPVRIATEPVDYWITVTVEPRPEHRWLIIEADGAPGEYRRSDLALEGERAALIRQHWFKGLRAGCYIFAASVADTSRILASAYSDRKSNV